MKTKMGVGLDNQSNGLQCGRETARAALRHLNGEHPTLALLFTSHPRPDEVLKGVNQVLEGVPLIGATSTGEYAHEGYVEDGAGVMLICSDDIRFHPLSYRRRWFSRGNMLGNLQGTSHDGLGSPYHYRTLMLFPDDQSMNLDRVVDRAMTETGMLYDILGGPGPTIPKPPRPPAVFYNQYLIRTGLVGAEILSRQPLGLALANGWSPLSAAYRVTQVDTQRIVRIDGRPAQEVYEDFLAEQGYPFHQELPHHLLLKHPIGVCKDGSCKVSVVMGFDEVGALQTASPPPLNSLIHILGTKTEYMVAAAERVVSEASAHLKHQPAGLLFIDCMSTAMLLEDAYQQQRHAVANAAGDLPFLGFRSHGVLARIQGQTAGHYECSVATWMLPGSE